MIQLGIIFTDSIQEIPVLPISILEPIYQYRNADIIFRILADTYQLLTFRLISVLTRKNIKSYEGNPISNFKDDTIQYINNSLHIGKYILAPIAKNYNYKVISYIIFYYYKILPSIPKGNITIVKMVGPWEVHDSILELNFELELFLLNHGFSDIKTVFIFISYGQVTLPTKYQLNSDYKHNYIIESIDDLNTKKINNFIKNSDTIMLDGINIVNCTACYQDVINLPLDIFLNGILLDNLNPHGSMFVYHMCYQLAYPALELLYYTSLQFEKMEILTNNIIVEHIGYIKFSNYKSTSKLSSLIPKYKRKDKYLGQRTTTEKSEYCKLHEPLYSSTTSIYIKHILNHIEPKFIDKMFQVYQQNNLQVQHELDKISHIKLHNLDSILSNNVWECIQFCNKYNIEINDMYDDFKPIQYLKVIKEYFPKKSKVDYSKLQLSTDSIYSITRPSESLKMIRILKHAFKSIDTILVGTANVGTTTIAFAEHYKQIYAVEIDETTYDHLKTNIQIYGYKNVDVIHEDIVVFMKSKLKTIHYNPVTYLLFLDPPWSGVFYKTEQNIDLYLSGINVIDFIKSIHVKYVCMKVPFNYNIAKLYTSFYNFTIYRLSGFLVVLIIL